RQPACGLVSGRCADSCDLSGPQQILRGRWPRRRCGGTGLGRDLGPHARSLERRSRLVQSRQLNLLLCVTAPRKIDREHWEIALIVEPTRRNALAGAAVLAGAFA